jgi:hypothetical protein
MNKQPPFTLHIFVADGDPDDLRLVERSNWNGKAVMFPQTLYTNVRNRAEFRNPVFTFYSGHTRKAKATCFTSAKATPWGQSSRTILPIRIGGRRLGQTAHAQVIMSGTATLGNCRASFINFTAIPQDFEKAGMFCVVLPHGRDEKKQQEHSSRCKGELAAADLQLRS